MQKEQQCKCPIIKNLCTFEDQQESQDDWSTASKMESESRDETGTKGIRLVGPRRTQVKNSDFVLNIIFTVEGREGRAE